MKFILAETLCQRTIRNPTRKQHDDDQCRHSTVWKWISLRIWIPDDVRCRLHHREIGSSLKSGDFYSSGAVAFQIVKLNFTLSNKLLKVSIWNGGNRLLPIAKVISAMSTRVRFCEIGFNLKLSNVWFNGLQSDASLSLYRLNDFR